MDSPERDGQLAADHPPTRPASSPLALWSAANLAGMATGRLVIREPLFRRLLNRILRKRRRRVLRLRRPAAGHSLSLLADVVVGSSRSTLLSVFGPPRSAVLQGVPPPGTPMTIGQASTWYYPIERIGQMAMAIHFNNESAAQVEFIRVRLG